MRRTILFLAVTATIAATPALADFHVCNRTSLPTRLAMGRFDGANWTSQGWWTVRPNTCAAILIGSLEGRYYYLYASDGATGLWDGKTHFCVAPNQTFKAAGRSDCAKRGFDSRGFFEVDTGNTFDWTQTLSN